MKKWIAGMGVMILIGAWLIATTDASAQGPRGTDRARFASIRAALVDAIGDAAGLTEAVVRQELRAGSSLADICAANTCDLEAARAAATAELESAIAVAVETGRMTQEDADAWLADLPDLLDTALEAAQPVRALLSDAATEAHATKQLLQTLLLMGDLTRADLVEAADEGLTLGALVSDAGLAEAGVIAQAQEHLANELQVWVDRERISSEERDTALAYAAESYPGLMEQLVSDLVLDAGRTEWRLGVRDDVRGRGLIRVGRLLGRAGR